MKLKKQITFILLFFAIFSYSQIKIINDSEFNITAIYVLNKENTCLTFNGTLKPDLLKKELLKNKTFNIPKSAIKKGNVIMLVPEDSDEIYLDNLTEDLKLSKVLGSKNISEAEEVAEVAIVKKNNFKKTITFHNNSNCRVKNLKIKFKNKWNLSPIMPPFSSICPKDKVTFTFTDKSNYPNDISFFEFDVIDGNQIVKHKSKLFDNNNVVFGYQPKKLQLVKNDSVYNTIKINTYNIDLFVNLLKEKKYESAYNIYSRSKVSFGFKNFKNFLNKHILMNYYYGDIVKIVKKEELVEFLGSTAYSLKLSYDIHYKKGDIGNIKISYFINGKTQNRGIGIYNITNPTKVLPEIEQQMSGYFKAIYSKNMNFFDANMITKSESEKRNIKTNLLDIFSKNITEITPTGKYVFDRQSLRIEYISNSGEVILIKLTSIPLTNNLFLEDIWIKN